MQKGLLVKAPIKGWLLRVSRFSHGEIQGTSMEPYQWQGANWNRYFLAPYPAGMKVKQTPSPVGIGKVKVARLSLLIGAVRSLLHGIEMREGLTWSKLSYSLLPLGGGTHEYFWTGVHTDRNEKKKYFFNSLRIL